jgi:hypothetical protein
VNDTIVIEVLYAAMRLLELVLDRVTRLLFAAAAKRQMNTAFVTTFTEWVWRKL